MRKNWPSGSRPAPIYVRDPASLLFIDLGSQIIDLARVCLGGMASNRMRSRFFEIARLPIVQMMLAGSTEKKIGRALLADPAPSSPTLNVGMNQVLEEDDECFARFGEQQGAACRSFSHELRLLGPQPPPTAVVEPGLVQRPAMTKRRDCENGFPHCS